MLYTRVPGLDLWFRDRVWVWDLEIANGGFGMQASGFQVSGSSVLSLRVRKSIIDSQETSRTTQKKGHELL